MKDGRSVINYSSTQANHTIRNEESSDVICPLPNVSLPCLKCDVVVLRSVRTSATVALMNTAAFLPAFRSSLGERTDSTRLAITFCVDGKS